MGNETTYIQVYTSLTQQDAYYNQISLKPYSANIFLSYLGIRTKVGHVQGNLERHAVLH